MLIMENVEHIRRLEVIGCDISDMLLISLFQMSFGMKMVILCQ
jgi:hypothetical protein